MTFSLVRNQLTKKQICIFIFLNLFLISCSKGKVTPPWDHDRGNGGEDGDITSNTLATSCPPSFSNTPCQKLGFYNAYELTGQQTLTVNFTPNNGAVNNLNFTISPQNPDNWGLDSSNCPMTLSSTCSLNLTYIPPKQQTDKPDTGTFNLTYTYFDSNNKLYKNNILVNYVAKSLKDNLTTQLDFTFKNLKKIVVKDNNFFFLTNDKTFEYATLKNSEIILKYPKEENSYDFDLSQIENNKVIVKKSPDSSKLPYFYTIDISNANKFLLDFSTIPSFNKSSYFSYAVGPNGLYGFASIYNDTNYRNYTKAYHIDGKPNEEWPTSAMFQHHYTSYSQAVATSLGEDKLYRIASDSSKADTIKYLCSANAKNLQEQFCLPVTNSSFFSVQNLSISNEKIFVVTTDSQILKINAYEDINGEVTETLFEYTQEYPVKIIGNPIFDSKNNLIYIISGLDNYYTLYALNANSKNEVKWSYFFDNSIQISEPNLTDSQNILLVSSEGKIFIFDPQQESAVGTPKLIYNLPTGDQINTNISLDTKNKTLYVPSMNSSETESHMYAFHLDWLN